MSGLGTQVREIKDNAGATTAFSGTATTTPANVPSSAGAVISGAYIRSEDNNLEVSFDGGTSYFPLNRNESISWNVMGEITQLSLRTSSGSADYVILLNREPA